MQRHRVRFTIGRLMIAIAASGIILAVWIATFDYLKPPRPEAIADGTLNIVVTREVEIAFSWPIVLAFFVVAGAAVSLLFYVARRRTKRAARGEILRDSPALPDAE